MTESVLEPIQAEVKCKGCTLKINDEYDFTDKKGALVHVQASIKVQGLRGATYAQPLPADLIDTLMALANDPDFARILSIVREREIAPQSLRDN